MERLRSTKAPIEFYRSNEAVVADFRSGIFFRVSELISATAPTHETRKPAELIRRFASSPWRLAEHRKMD